MSSVVKQFPPLIDLTSNSPSQNFDLRIGAPVLGTEQWSKYNDAVTWALAQGGTLVMQGPSSTLVTPGDLFQYRYYVWQRYQPLARLWCVTLQPTATVVDEWDAFGYVQFPTGGTLPWHITRDSFGRLANLRFIETLASPADAVGEISFYIQNDDDSLCNVMTRAIACYELPRTLLSDFGPNPSALGAFRAKTTPNEDVATGALMAESLDQGRGIAAVVRNVNDATMMMAETRRSFFTDYRQSGQNVGTTYLTLFKRDIPVLARARYYGETTVSVGVAAYCNAASGGSVRFTAASGDSTVLSTPTGGLDWVTGTLAIETEDVSRLGVSGGVRLAGRDRVKIEAKSTSGTCTVKGVSIYSDS